MSKLLEIRDLVADFMVREGVIRAVDHVSLDLEEGKVMGLVGESGCGKTSLVQAITRVMPYNYYIREGEVLFKGKNLLKLNDEELRKIRWEKIAQVFQSVQNALNPFLTIETQFIESVRAHRDMSKKEIIDRSRRLLESVGLDSRVLKSYPHQLSGGMKQRVGIAMSLILEPELLILDEPISALDILHQAIINEDLRRVHEKTKITMLYVTHDIASLVDLVDEVAIMYCGKIVEKGTKEVIFSEPLHPYSQALLASVLSPDGIAGKAGLSGDPPSLLLQWKPKGCVFHPRCPQRLPDCEEIEPKLTTVNEGSLVACHRIVR